MADNLAQKIADQLTERDIELLRLAAGDQRRMNRAIRELSEELVSRVIRYSPTTKVSIDALIDESVGIIRRTYERMYTGERQQLVEVLRDELGIIPAAIETHLGVSASVAHVLADNNVSESILTDIIDNRVMTINANDAERLRGFFEREAAAHHRRVAGAVRQSFSQIETIPQMIARLRALSEIHARELDGILRTAYNHAVSHLRIEMMQRNSTLFRGVIAIVTLDTRTSKVCMGRSRGMWNVNNGRPLPESPIQIPYPGTTPWHHACRTQLYPLTRGVREIGRMGNEQVKEAMASLSEEQRNLLSPDPPDDETYTQWLRRQSADRQNQVLGPSRRKLWLEGKLELADLVTQRGRPLRLDELQRRIKRNAS